MVLRSQAFRLLARFCAEDLVAALYRGTLRRDPAPDELTERSAELQGAAGLGELLSRLIDSAEFRHAQQSAFASEWVPGLLRALLGHEPASHPVTRGDIDALAAAVVGSEEFRKANCTALAPELLRGLYLGLLGREPDPHALGTYSKRLAERDFRGTVADIVGSGEFMKRTLAALAPGWVRAIYQGLLGREPETRALAYYTNRLSQHADLAPVLTEIVRSEEFRKTHAPRGARPQAKAAGPVAQPRHSFSVRDLETPKLVFLHHPKSGGTTLHRLLIKAFDKHEVCPERFNGLRHYPAGDLAGYRFFSGHFDLPSVRLIPGRKTVVTMIREPVARLISLYYFQRAHRAEAIEERRLKLARLANKYGMKEFFSDPEVRLHPAINNSLTRLLVDTLEKDRWEQDARLDTPASEQFVELALRELSSLDAFGLMERYDESVELICAAAGLKVPAHVDAHQVLDVIMDQEAGLRRIEKEPVTDEIRRLITQLVQVDVQVYRRASEVFEERLTTLRRRTSAPREGEHNAGRSGLSPQAGGDQAVPPPHAGSRA